MEAGMAEGPQVREQDLTSEFTRIERAVDAGETDLSALGFWRLVKRVKLSPEAVERYGDQVGRIDAAAFRRGVPRRWPVWLGNAVLTGGVVAGALAIEFALRVSSSLLKGLALVAAGVLWSVCSHSLAHWLVGRLVGIRFTDYFIGGPPPPRPGLKTDYASYLRTPAERRAWMHASGAIATKVAPFVPLLFWSASGAPVWSALLLLAIGAVQIVTDVLFSVRSSDWKKVLRERAIAREVAALAD
jgi:hypothetical protein